MRYVTHVRCRLALHDLRGGDGRPLLLLHGLGERTPSEVPDHLSQWPGPVVGLDFTGHGLSTIPHGGGYTPEQLMGDVDAALAELGEVTILGRGLGAYVGLLVAGARPTTVLGAVLADGPGLAGGGPGPGVNPVAWAPSGPPRAPDPYALVELSRDLRPPDYTAELARQACALSPLDVPITVAAALHPPWLEEILGLPGIETAPLDRALARYADPSD